MSNEDIRKSIQEIYDKVDRLSKSREDHEILNLIDSKITAWEKKRATVILILFAIIGITSWTTLREKIANYFVSNVKGKINHEVMIKTASLSQDPAIAELKDQISNIESELKDLRDTLNVTETATSQSKVPAIPSDGFSFFGIRDSSGLWSERHFKIVGNGKRPPKPGDKLIAEGSVNVREGYITYTVAGWTNQPSKGILRKGDQVIVDEVREVVNGFWWIAFHK